MPEVKPHDPAAEGVAAVGAKFQEMHGRAEAPQARRPPLPARDALVRHHRPAGRPARPRRCASPGSSSPSTSPTTCRASAAPATATGSSPRTAVLIDTAGRYVQQESQPEVDAAEWLGFLDLLKKHRGRRALNGVIVALSADDPRRGRRRDPRPRPRDPQAPGRAQRSGSRSACRSTCSSPRPTCQGLRAELRGPLHRRARAGLGRDLRARRAGRRRRGRPRARRARRSGSKAASARAWRARRQLATRAEIFRFPAQVASLEAPLQPARRHRLRREPLRGERLAARLLPDLGHPGGHADRPAGRRARLGLRPAGRAAPTPRRASSGAASSCAGS